MKRSLAILIIASLQLIVNSLSCVSSVFLLLLITGTRQIFSHDLTTLSSTLKGLVGLGLIISLFGLVVTYGLWSLKRWGWIGSLIFQGLCITNKGLSVLAGEHFSVRVGFAIAFCLALFLALWLPSTRNAIFGEMPPEVQGQES